MPDPVLQPKTIREAVASPPIRPSLDALVDHFYALAGGAEAVAKMLFDEYKAAREGSMIRQRILETILRTHKTTDAGRQLDDMGLVTDADIEREIDRREQAVGLPRNAPEAGGRDG